MTILKEYRLSDLMQIKYGKDHKHLADGSYPLYGSGGIMRYVEKPLYDDESILIPRKGTLSNLFYLDQPFWSVDTMFYSKINKDLVLPKYLFYTLKTCDLASLNVGSAVPSLTTEVLNEVLVTIPDLYTQTTIAEILSSLDDKIELNNKINQELETLAQTLFKHWFIDFEFPNENGEPYKSSGGEMVNSEFGEIPKGWTHKSLFDCAEYINGAAYKDKYFTISEDSLPVIKIVELKTGISSQTKYSNVNLGDKYKIVTGDILFSWSGSPETSIDIFLWAEGNAWLNQHIFKIVCKNNFERAFVYSMLKYWKPVFISIAKDKQTTGLGHVTIKDLKERLQSYPTEKILNDYGKSAIPIIDLMLNNLEEKNNLVKIRDTLLPKLISGELEIKELPN